VDFAERAARNEEVFRDVNERIEEGAEQHHVSGSLPFHCEYGASACFETIEIPPSRYAAIVRERYHFVVLLGHEEPRTTAITHRNATTADPGRRRRRASRRRARG
jgi:hypothetical protein